MPSPNVPLPLAPTPRNASSTPQILVDDIRAVSPASSILSTPSNSPGLSRLRLDKPLPPDPPLRRRPSSLYSRLQEEIIDLYCESLVSPSPSEWLKGKLSTSNLSTQTLPIISAGELGNEPMDVQPPPALELPSTKPRHPYLQINDKKSSGSISDSQLDKISSAISPSVGIRRSKALRHPKTATDRSTNRFVLPSTPDLTEELAALYRRELTVSPDEQDSAILSGEMREDFDSPPLRPLSFVSDDADALSWSSSSAVSHESLEQPILRSPLSMAPTKGLPSVFQSHETAKASTTGHGMARPATSSSLLAGSAPLSPPLTPWPVFGSLRSPALIPSSPASSYFLSPLSAPLPLSRPNSEPRSLPSTSPPPQVHCLSSVAVPLQSLNSASSSPSLKHGSSSQSPNPGSPPARSSLSHPPPLDLASAISDFPLVFTRTLKPSNPHKAALPRRIRSPAIPLTPYQRLGPKAWELEDLPSAADCESNKTRQSLLRRYRHKYMHRHGLKQRDGEDLKSRIRLLTSTARNSMIPRM